MSKYVYSYSVYNEASGKVIALGFDNRTDANALAMDAELLLLGNQYKVRQHRTLRGEA